MGSEVELALQGGISACQWLTGSALHVLHAGGAGVDIGNQEHCREASLWGFRLLVAQL